MRQAAEPVLSCDTTTVATLSPEELWFEEIRPDFAQGNISIIAGAKKLIEAKRALKKRDGSFPRLVEKLGMDLGKAERLMKIARHPVLGNSAHAPIMPVSWTVLYMLSALSAETLERLLADGTVHPGLERKEAEGLVRKARESNSNGGARGGDRNDDCGGSRGDDGGDHTEDRGGDSGDHSEHHDAGGAEDEDHSAADRGVDRDSADPPPQTSVVQDDSGPGPDSRGELDRKLARLEELERELCLWDRRRGGFESEIQELKARLDETTVPHQRRLFRQALRSLEKAETSDLGEKEKRKLRADATTDLVEFVRAAARDGLRLERFDIVCRPESH
jgi:hypothetical protein